MNRKQKKVLFRIIISAILLLAVEVVFNGRVSKWSLFALYLLPYLIIGYDILLKALNGIMNRRVFDENFLMAVATLGAIALALWQGGDYVEAIAVMLFYQVGELFQSYAVGKSRQSISSLMDIRPDYANLENNGTLVKIDPDEVAVGAVIIVNPGEKVPIDGVVIQGSSTLNTVALTGESMPRDVVVGNDIQSGCINLTSPLKVKTTKIFGESTVSKILELVENASSRKSKSEAFISKFARVYTPFVCYSALALAIIPPLFCILANMDPNWSNWIYRSLIFLIISCPCALVVSVPLSFFAGLGGASRKGILIKGSNFIETLAKTKYVVFDKTGTLTKGIFEVNAIHHHLIDDSQIIEYAALAESASSHPISKSIQQAYGKSIDRNRVDDIKEISGHGITAMVDGISVALGNSKLMDKLNILYKDCHKLGTIIHMAINGVYAGHIVIADAIKLSSQNVVSELKNVGIKNVVMLTGDAKNVAVEVANKLGVDKVETLINQKNKNEMLAFVGDGINDAPVLSRADVGIAMGQMGSDAAIEAADVVIIDDDPIKVAKAIKISRKCLAIVHENIWFALSVKILCLILGACGFANMWLAVFADVGVTVIAILNAIRALFVNKL
jgi:Zn2+/Cd2+-exporting ATPase